MVTDKNKLESIVESCSVGLASKAGLLVLMLLTVIVLLPSLSHADGLFDFQMKLAQKGNAEAQFKVGEMYETGFGVKEDMTEAGKWITKAADQGHETAGFKLLYWDMEKNGVTDKNKADVDALKAKAEAGNGQAQYYVGKMNANGVGTKKNPDQAIKWLNKAALVGVLEAEREIVFVREDKLRADAAAKRRAQEKKQAELRAKQERERKARLEAQRKKQEQQQLEAKARAEKNKADADARAKANKQASEQARAQAEKEALARRQAEEVRRKAEKQALLKKRAEQESKRKAQFESDPCSGKSARFLSTCK